MTNVNYLELAPFIIYILSISIIELRLVIRVRKVWRWKDNISEDRVVGLIFMYNNDKIFQIRFPWAK